MSSLPRSFLLVSTLALVGTSARVASAQPAAAEVARSVKLFDEAKKELDAGHVEKACGLFSESYRLDPQVGTLLNTALCHEKAGKNASAWAEFTTVVSLASRAAQPKRADLARTKARALEPILARVRFEVRERAADLVVSVDGTALSDDALRSTAIPFDPGEHLVRATAGAKKEWQAKLVIAAGPSTTPLVIPALEDAPPPVAVTVTTKTPAAAPPASDGSSTSPLRWAAYGGAGAAVVALAVGGITGALAISKQHEADQQCAGAVCRTESAASANESARGLATVSTVGFLAAGVLAATTVVLFVLSPPSRASSGSARAAAPFAGLRF